MYIKRGTYFNVGSNVAGSNLQVIISKEDVQGLTPEELGNRVLQSFPEAVQCWVEESADFIPHFVDDACIETLLDWKALLLQADYQPSDDIDLLETVQERITKLERRQKGKVSRAQYRKELQKHYNDFFVTVGNRDGFQCAFCLTTEDLCIDHRHPLIEGGTNDLENLQLLCRSCNSKKSDKLPKNAKTE